MGLAVDKQSVGRQTESFRITAQVKNRKRYYDQRHGDTYRDRRRLNPNLGDQQNKQGRKHDAADACAVECQADGLWSISIEPWSDDRVDRRTARRAQPLPEIAAATNNCHGADATDQATIPAPARTAPMIVVCANPIDLCASGKY